MTSFFLYSLSRQGFAIDILQFGMPVIMDVINLSSELRGVASGKTEDRTIDLRDCEEMVF